MGLLKCPDCGKEFSDRIDACPNCACPKSAVLKELESKKEVQVNNEIKSEEINPFKYTKKDLMSYEELKIFSIQSILPYIFEELKINKADISECDAQYGVDFIAKTTDGAIGIKFIIDIAPNKSIKLYDEDAAKKMYSLGFKFAVAQIGVGSKDELRFQRRVVLKNDGYLFNYTGLKYFEYKDYSNVRLSLSEDTSWKYIFNPQTNEENPYTIKKEKRACREDFNSDSYEPTIQGLFDKYYIQSRHREFLKEYILSLAESIQYSLSAENTLVNFMNCVDYCQGLFLSSSKAVKENKIILKTIELLEENSLISLDKYELFNFGFYVYYFLKNGGTNAEMISSSLADKMKIDLYYSTPELFGFEKKVIMNSGDNELKKVLLELSNPNHITKLNNKSVCNSFDEYYSAKASKSLKNWKTTLGVLLIISAAISLVSLILGNYFALVDIVLCLVFGVLIFKNNSWIYALLVAIYQGIAVIINLDAGKSTVNLFPLVISLIVMFGIIKLKKEYESGN